MTSRTENRIDHIIIIPPPSPSMADIASPSSLSVGSRNSSLQSISEPPTPSPPAVTVSNEDKYRQETDVPDEKEHLSLSDMEAVLHTASLIERGRLGGKKNFAFARLLMELLEQDRPEKTASFYRKKSLEENQSCAQTSLGQAYWFGNGVEQDLTKAQEYLALAAQGGNARAWMLLGHLPHEDERNSTVEEQSGEDTSVIVSYVAERQVVVGTPKREDEEMKSESNEYEYLEAYEECLVKIEALEAEVEEQTSLIKRLKKARNFASSSSSSVMKISGRNSIVPKICGIPIDKVDKLNAVEIAKVAREKGIKVGPLMLRKMRCLDAEGMNARRSILAEIYPEEGIKSSGKKVKVRSTEKKQKSIEKKPSVRKPHSLDDTSMKLPKSTNRELYHSSTPANKKRKVESNTKTPESVVENESCADSYHSGDRSGEDDDDSVEEIEEEKL